MNALQAACKYAARAESADRKDEADGFRATATMYAAISQAEALNRIADYLEAEDSRNELAASVRLNLRTP